MLRAFLCLFLTGGMCATTFAQEPKKVDGAASAGAREQLAKPATKIPEADELLILIRTSLLALNDAIATENFTVLRDRVAPSVREQNSPSRLSQIFAPLIAQRLDLSAAAILPPKLQSSPTIDSDGRLRVTGFYPGPKLQTNFEITFEVVKRRWQLYGLNVSLAPAEGVRPARLGAPPPDSKAKK